MDFLSFLGLFISLIPIKIFYTVLLIIITDIVLDPTSKSLINHINIFKAYLYEKLLVPKLSQTDDCLGERDAYIFQVRVQFYI